MSKVIGWSCEEVIGISIINPRGLDPYLRIGVKIRDFCWEHSSKKQMRDFIGEMFIKHPEFANQIKDEILKICPQYRDLIDKLMVLM